MVFLRIYATHLLEAVVNIRRIRQYSPEYISRFGEGMPVSAQ